MVLEDVVITSPLRIEGSEVAFINVGIGPEVAEVADLIQVRDSTFHLYYPALSSPALPGNVPGVIHAERSVIVIQERGRDLPPEEQYRQQYLDAFSAILDSRIVFTQPGNWGGLPPAKYGQPPIQWQGNVVEFHNGSGAALGPGLWAKFFGPADLGEPVVGYDVRFEANNVVIADFRTWGQADIRLREAQATDTWYFVDQVSVRAEDSDVNGTFLGRSRGEFVRCRGPGLVVFDQAEVTIASSELGVVVGGQATVTATDSTLSAIALDEATLRLEGVTVPEPGYVMALGSATVTLERVRGRLRAYQTATLYVKDSDIDEVYLFDKARLVVENSRVGAIYYQVTVEGAVTINTTQAPPWWGDGVANEVTVDRTSQVGTLGIGQVVVKEGGSLVVQDSRLEAFHGGVYVYGDAHIVNSTIGTLLVYGPRATVTLKDSTVAHLYDSLHITGEGEVDAQGYRGAVTPVTARDLGGSKIQEQRVGHIGVHQGARATITGRTLESLMVDGTGEATFRQGELRQVRAEGQARVTLEEVVFSEVRYRLHLPASPLDRVEDLGALLSTRVPAQVEVSGSARVTLRRSTPPGPLVRVTDSASFRLEEGVAHLRGQDRARVTVVKGGAAFVLVNQAQVKGFNGRVGNPLGLLLDRATLVSVFDSGQDLVFGRRYDSRAWGMAVGFFLLPQDNPLAAQEGEAPYLSGTVYVKVWGMAGDPRLAVHYTDPLRYGFWDEVSVAVDGVFLERTEEEPYPPGAFLWDTTRFDDGWHTVTVVARKGDQENHREVQVEVRN